MLRGMPGVRLVSIWQVRAEGRMNVFGPTGIGWWKRNLVVYVVEM